ncbi:MAG TPA: carboxypeptidase regulatory-like domain-containing protein, partial [Candidatus Thermoplasmatota archaeon]
PTSDSPISDAETGIVRGVVIDESQLPLENVTVALGAATTDSDGAGQFEFKNILVGKHTLRASLQGYLNASLDIEVEADSATEVRLRLQQTATSAPYHESQTQTGIHACGVGWRTGPAPPGYTGLCIALQHAGASVVDRSMLSFHVKISNATGFWHESTWSPSTPLRGGMNVIWGYVLDDGLSLNDVADNGSRESPLRLTSMIEDWIAAITGTPSVFCNAAECELRSFHSSYGETLGPSSPADAGVVVNQRYDVWLTTFYNGPVPAEFTALPPA